MSRNRIFYYPHSAFEDDQRRVLQAAAFYFDELYVLDPESRGSRSQQGISDDVALLEQERILHRVNPRDILAQYEPEITAAVREDLQDPAFVEACRTYPGPKWRIALEKVPDPVRRDFLGLGVDWVTGQFRYLDNGPVHLVDSWQPPTRREPQDPVYMEIAVPLAASVLLNHALFGGLLRTGATPLTDRPLQNTLLNIKIKRARNIPTLRVLLDEPERQRQVRADLFAMQALQDSLLNLPAMNPAVRMPEILEFRQEHKDELAQAREALGWMARRIEQEAWTPDFAQWVEHNGIPDVHDKLEEVQKARDAWLRKRNALLAKTAGIAAAVGAATIGLAMTAPPLAPLALASGVVGLAKEGVIPAIELIQEWRGARQEASENALSYFLMAQEQTYRTGLVG
jgi:hypothetical protein